MYELTYSQANFLMRNPETGHGYQTVLFEMKNGDTHQVIVENSYKFKANKDIDVNLIKSIYILE